MKNVERTLKRKDPGMVTERRREGWRETRVRRDLGNACAGGGKEDYAEGLEVLISGLCAHWTASPTQR